jgi:hypothetical protein
VGEFGSDDAWREERTNSGESNLEMWDRKSGRHGAAPTEEGVVDVVDIVRERRRRRVAGEEAMVVDFVEYTGKSFCLM